MAFPGLFDFKQAVENDYFKEYLSIKVNDELGKYIDNRYFIVQNLGCSKDGRSPQHTIKLVYYIGINTSDAGFHTSFSEMNCLPDFITTTREDIERRKICLFVNTYPLYMLQPGTENIFVDNILRRLVEGTIKDIRENYIDKNVELYGADLSIRDKVYEKPKTKWILEYRRDDV